MAKVEILPGAQDLADQIDSDLLVKYLKSYGRLPQDRDTPLIGKYFYNSETNRIEYPLDPEALRLRRMWDPEAEPNGFIPYPLSVLFFYCGL